MQGVTVQQAGWLKENRDKRLLFSGKVSKEWQKRSITFTPKADGSVAISFMSSKKDGAFIGYRNLQITGSSLKNQKLAAGSNGLPTSWGSSENRTIAKTPSSAATTTAFISWSPARAAFPSR